MDRKTAIMEYISGLKNQIHLFSYIDSSLQYLEPCSPLVDKQDVQNAVSRAIDEIEQELSSIELFSAIAGVDVEI